MPMSGRNFKLKGNTSVNPCISMHVQCSKVERSEAVQKCRVTVHMFFEQSIRAAALNSLSERLGSSKASDNTCSSNSLFEQQL